MGIFDIFKRKEKLGIGIDIGSTGIKIAITTPTKSGGYRIKNIIHRSLPPGVVDKGNILDPERLISALKSVKGKIPPGTVSYAFSPYKTTLFSFRLIKEVKEIDKAVYKELSYRIPLPLSELSVDYDYITKEDGTKIVTVIVGKKKSIEDVVGLMEEAGIKVDSVTSSYTAIANVALLGFADILGKACGMIVDMGHSMCCCVCINSGILTHGGCIEDGTRLIEEVVANNLSAPLEEVREKILSCDVPSELLDQALFRFFDRILGEIDAYSTLCQSETPVPCEEFHIIGTGGGSAVCEMCERISMHMGKPYPVKILDPLSIFEMDPNVMERLERLGSTRFTVALGASLI